MIWVRRYGGFIGFALLGLGVVWGLIQVGEASNAAQDAADHAEMISHDNAQAINDIETERTVRTRAVNGVIFLGCSRDNKQDLLLGGLIAGSLKQAKGRQLGPRQQQIVAQYRRKLHDLLQVPKCADVVKAFLRAANAPVDTGSAPLPADQKHPKAGG